LAIPGGVIVHVDNKDIFAYNSVAATAYTEGGFVKWSADNCRKYGIVMMGTAQTQEEVARDFPTGTFASFTTLVDLTVGGKYVVDVIDPAKNEILVPKLNTRLPGRILSIIGR